jgi:hypothetical protein
MRSTGIKIVAKHKYHNEVADPGEGLHLWTVLAMWQVTPAMSGGYNLDVENLVTIEGPGCYKCEQRWSAELAARPCTGSLELQ